MLFGSDQSICSGLPIYLFVFSRPYGNVIHHVKCYIKNET
uniref:Uncharacterized protein n=1 Tax=Rhizophora mucronata TaxID=61149 RepID=A0A2P2PBM2_RHIMU